MYKKGDVFKYNGAIPELKGRIGIILDVSKGYHTGLAYHESYIALFGDERYRVYEWTIKKLSTSNIKDGDIHSRKEKS